MFDELAGWLDDMFETLPDALSELFESSDDAIDPWDIADSDPTYASSIVDSSPVLGSVQELLADCARDYREISGEATVPTSIASTQSLLDDIGSADPEQLRLMSAQLKGMTFSDSVMTSISDHYDTMLERNAGSEAAVAAYREQLEADALNASAADLVDDTNRDLGTTI